MRSSFLLKSQPKITGISALPSNKLPGQKSFKFLVGILEETMTSKIHSEFNWPLPKVGWQVVMVGSQSASSRWERVDWSVKTYLSGQLPALPTHLLRPCLNSIQYEFNVTDLMFKRKYVTTKQVIRKRYLEPVFDPKTKEKWISHPVAHPQRTVALEMNVSLQNRISKRIQIWNVVDKVISTNF